MRAPMPDIVSEPIRDMPAQPDIGLRPPAPLALLCNAREEDYAQAAEIGFTHVLLDDASQISGARGCGLVPVIALQEFDEETLGALQEAGAGGFYFRAAHRFAAIFWYDRFGNAKQRKPDVLLIADILGARPEEVAALRGAGFDLATSSSCYWDFASGWLNQDTLRTESVAPVLAFATPPGSASWQPVALKRALRFSAMFAPAWAVDWRFVFQGDEDMRPELRELLALRAQMATLVGCRAGRVISAAGAPVAVFLRGCFVSVANGSIEAKAGQPVAHLLPIIGGAGLRALGGDAFSATEMLTTEPAEVAFFTTLPAAEISLPAPKLDTGAPRIAIEAISPQVDEGRFPARRVVGEAVEVEADLIADGHELLAAELLYRAGREQAWRVVPMLPVGNDRWRASFPLEWLGRYGFVVQAWYDRFSSFADGLRKKIAAGLNVALEIQEGLLLVDEAAEADKRLRSVANELRALPADGLREWLLSEDLRSAMRHALPRKFLTKSREMPLDAEPRGARFASWYELFPRSQSGDATRHGTFADVVAQLPRIAAMGFDVLYFPPIHPIGAAHRKGRNNSLTAAPDDPGSPYAIGSEDGGHDAIHPQLGTLEDFRALVAEASGHGLSIALDFAIQCSPDHPWLRQHKGWFDWRPDGSLRYAENPPKKYEDIVNVDFYTEAAKPDLWLALRDVVQFWVDQGVRYFRVDNPHTKPLPFWEWMIADIRSRHPDAIFLAEAFTRPKVMYRLAKIGFSQSYTYFTWRNEKHELTAYLEELANGPAREYFRPHVFVNTPDINPHFLQTSGRGGFLIRAALAATLSGLFGVYNGFELCEAAPVPGKEEYLDSEKYEIKAWDYEKPGNISAQITALNLIRRENAALQSHLGVEFLPCSNEKIIYFRRFAPGASTLLIAVSLDPHTVQEASIELPLWRF
ncbi:MAG: alpha-1,4-glucan--maltose-1-phosphate maltosyltransferase, partial [Rhodospirillales bacterium]|nr:alpha-1,4-glucan--maltose-1-phosphate maltosyltransferase [Rhodospirillales bacterium]